MSKIIFRNNIGVTKTKSGGNTKVCSTPISSQTFDYYISTTGNDANPGTLASPWAITALWTKASTYAGKRLGILDGTYHGYYGIYDGTNDCGYYIPSTAAGTSGARTVIGSVNARGAILVGDGGNLGGAWSRVIVGLVCNASYVTLENLHLREAAEFGFFITTQYVYTFGNHVERIDRVTYGDGGYNNQVGITYLTSAHNGWVAHNYVHDIVAGSSLGANEVCIQLYHCQNAVVEYNECYDANCGIYLKEDDGGSVVRYNYVHGCGRSLYYGTNDAFAVDWYGNVIEDWNYSLYIRDNQNEAAGTSFYNNTFIYNTSGGTGFWLVPTSGNNVDFYNNLLVRQGSGGATTYGDMTIEGGGGFGIADYNLYGTTATFHSPAGSSRTFSAYKTQIGGLEFHSQQADPTFVGGGSGPYQWKLDTGSNGLGDGSSDGTTGGIAVNIGAFRSSGQTEQIGPDWRWPA